MSRSFTVRTNYFTQITLQDMIHKLVELQDFEQLVTLKHVNIIKNFNGKSTVINHNFSKILLNDGYTVFEIENNYIFITYYHHEHIWYSVESRALFGKGKDLFVAIASVLASLTEGKVGSGDGAWSNGNMDYSGSGLWNEYLSTERKNILQRYDKL